MVAGDVTAELGRRAEEASRKGGGASDGREGGAYSATAGNAARRSGCHIRHFVLQLIIFVNAIFFCSL